MARRTNKIETIISARDLATATLRKVQLSTVALGVAIGNLATSLLTKGLNAIRGWLNVALENEQANIRLKGALAGVGQMSDEVVESLGKQIKALQAATGASNTLVTQQMTQLIAMGISTDKVGDAVRMVKALEGANIRGEQAMRAVARALQGDYDGFNRLVPAVRTAKTELEKIRAINATLATGQSVMEDNLNSVSGAWSALTARIGDFKNDIVEVIFRGARLGSTLREIQDNLGKLKDSEGFQGFLAGIERAASMVADIASAFSSGQISFGDMAKDFGTLILAALKDGAEMIGRAISDALGKQWWGSRSDSQRMETLQKQLERAQRAAQLQASAGAIGGFQDNAAGQVKLLQEKIKALQDKIDAGGTNFARAMKKIEEELEKAKPTKSIDDIFAEYERQLGINQPGKAAAPQLAIDTSADEAASRKRREQLDYFIAHGKIINDLKKKEEENQRAKLEAEEAIRKAQEAEKAAAEKAAKARDKAAWALEQNVGQLIDHARAERQQGKDAVREMKNEDRMRKKVNRAREQLEKGQRITRSQQDLIRAFDIRELAVRDAKQREEEHQAAQKRIDELQKKRDKVQEDILTVQTQIRDNLDQAVKME